MATELEILRNRYKTAMAKSPTSYTENDVVVIERAAVQYDFNQKTIVVRRCLKRARGLAKLQGRALDVSESAERQKTLRADLAVVERFAGIVEARRLLGTDEIPVWSLEG